MTDWTPTVNSIEAKKKRTTKGKFIWCSWIWMRYVQGIAIQKSICHKTASESSVSEKSWGNCRESRLGRQNIKTVGRVSSWSTTSPAPRNFNLIKKTFSLLAQIYNWISLIYFPPRNCLSFSQFLFRSQHHNKVGRPEIKLFSTELESFKSIFNISSLSHHSPVISKVLSLLPHLLCHCTPDTPSNKAICFHFL